MVNLAAATISQIPSLRLERLKAEYVKGVSLLVAGGLDLGAFRSTIPSVSMKSFGQY